MYVYHILIQWLWKQQSKTKTIHNKYTKSHSFEVLIVRNFNAYKIITN